MDQLPLAENPPNREKRLALVLFSGGLDSTTLLYRMLSIGWDVLAISFDYKQRHARELAQGTAIIERATEQFPNRSIARYTIPLPIDKASGLFAASALTGQAEIPEGHYADDNMAVTVVPGRNTIMLAMAMAIAQAQRAEYICIAAHAGDHAQYPDCREDYILRMAQVINLATEGESNLLAPFLRKTKAEIVSEGAKFGVPFELTYSCYKGGDISCAICGTCYERRWAFIEAGVPDPTTYDLAGLEKIPDSMLEA